MWVEQRKDFACHASPSSPTRGINATSAETPRGTSLIDRLMSGGATDRRSKSKTVAKKGEGDRGDQKRR
jgi:hypothetical protein